MRYIVPILFLLMISPLVAGEPYWLKEGVYFKYIASGEHSVVFTPSNSEGIDVYRGSYGEFIWRIVKVEGDFATVEAVLKGRNLTEERYNELSYEEGVEKLRELVSSYEKEKPSRLEDSCEIYSIRNSTLGEGIARICSTSISLEFSNYTYALKVERGKSTEFIRKTIPELKRRAFFKIDLKNNIMIINGTPQGKNLLFIYPGELSPDEPLFNLSGQEVKIFEVSKINDTIIHVPFKTFLPPILGVQTNTVSTSHGGMGRDVLYYDASSGVLITGFMPFSPVWEALGFSSVVFFNAGSKIHSGEMDGFGMVLGETNAELSEVRHLSGVAVSKGYLGLFGLSLLVLALAGIKLGRRWK